MWKASQEREKRLALPVTDVRAGRGPRLDIPDGATRFSVDDDAAAEVRSHRSATRARRRAPAATSSSPRPRETLAWLLLAVMVVGIGLKYLLDLPVPAPSTTPTAAGPASTASDEAPSKPSDALDVPIPVAEDGPVQLSAPEVVEALFGDGADQWTFERILDESTLRVEVPPDEMGAAVIRASRTLRTPSGRKAWRSLGADYLEIRSGPVAVGLSLVSSGPRSTGQSRTP
jgi:hypothetical protein